MKIRFLKDFKVAVQNPAWLCFLWVGMTAGISFVGIPEIFTAPAVTRPVALDAGRVVFEALNQAELIALVLLLILVRVSGQARTLWAYVCVLALIQLSQSAWLLPELAARAQQITAGIEPSPSSAHAIFGILAVAKLLLLTFLGFHTLGDRQSKQ